MEKFIFGIVQFFYLVLFLTLSESTPLTIDLLPISEECLYLDVPMAGCMVKYYYNIQDWSESDEFMNYQIYYKEIENTNVEKILFRKHKNEAHADEVMVAHKEHQRIGEWKFKAQKKGEYQICFSTKTPKVIDIDLLYDCSNVELEDNDALVDPLDDKTISLKEINDLANDNKLNAMVLGLEDQVSNLRETLDYYKLRNSRNLKTVESTLKRINLFSFGNMVLITLICTVQFVFLSVLFKPIVNKKNTISSKML
ncbi:hypothetical protein QEN19_003647 [Hanseniaspora menglaensis]